MAAVTRDDIIDWIKERFPHVSTISIDEGLPGSVKITVAGITKDEQLWIHDNLGPELPVGIRIDVHRAAGPCPTCGGLGRTVTRTSKSGGEICPACKGDGIGGPRASEWDDKNKGRFIRIERKDTPWNMDE